MGGGRGSGEGREGERRSCEYFYSSLSIIRLSSTTRVTISTSSNTSTRLVLVVVLQRPHKVPNITNASEVFLLEGGEGWGWGSGGEGWGAEVRMEVLV